ncbi:response regulator transcription factor [Abyssisolibacter fermentans]|uniref:response regulator transcription factor n=1 Tax=Abyssisolibacter fermentans TaxID=1766203 RepID=UPI00082EE1F9|nr:helix-turn-helix transcriptional regulator [Abyssisolibacter fermentans]
MISLSHNEWSLINDIVLKLHTTKDCYSAIKNLLMSLEVLIPHKKAFFDLGNYENYNFSFFNPISVNISEKHLTQYYKHYLHLDYANFVWSLDHPVVYKDTNILPDHLREQTIIYKNWMQSIGVHYGGGFSIFANDRLLGSITMFRDKDMDDFTNKDLYIMQIINLHLSKKLALLYPNGVSCKTDCYHENDLKGKYKLTNRQYEVTKLVFMGLNNKEISEKLFISKNTVKKHLTDTFKKLGVLNRSQLIKAVYEYFPESINI